MKRNAAIPTPEREASHLHLASHGARSFSPSLSHKNVGDDDKYDFYLLVRNILLVTRGSTGANGGGLRRLTLASRVSVFVWDSLSGKQRQTCNARSGNAVLCCRLSPDASIVAGGLSNYSVQLWSVCTGSLLSVYKGHTGWVYSLDFSPDGNRLVSASDDETVMIWNASSDEESQSPSLKRDFGVHYSPTGTVTVAAPDSRNRLLVLCGNEGEVICQTEKEQSRIRSCAVSHDGSTVAYGCEDGTLKLLRLAGCAIVRTEELVGHTATVRCCVFSSDDDMLVTCAEDHTLRVWSLDKGSCVICEGHQDVVWRCRLFHENSRVLSCSHDGSIRVWDVATGREVLCCAAHTEWVLCCDLSPDEKTMVSASVDRSVKLWSATTGKLLRSFTGHSDCVRSCAFSPCGRYIASGDDQGFVFLWDIHTGLLNVLSRHNSWVTDVHLSPGGNVIVSASDSVKFWRKDGELLQTFHVRGSFVKYVAPSADFSKFVTVDSAGILYVLERI
ncbi:PREDICTED: apoptotic protease-activating factor 1-like [Priapulus caudatus]|uniref:Apoptotic protease-activating factor 1-like n=1 Tax=Priapulus caudatus TaxID=37621 RepID=A0ABM1E3Q8_PRICU|nr:PREDICTED: apoptotic protease-activating factor 1-like [Priapulus caudatus]